MKTSSHDANENPIPARLKQSIVKSLSEFQQVWVKRLKKLVKSIKKATANFSTVANPWVHQWNYWPRVRLIPPSAQIAESVHQCSGLVRPAIIFIAADRDKIVLSLPYWERRVGAVFQKNWTIWATRIEPLVSTGIADGNTGMLNRIHIVYFVVSNSVRSS